MLSINSWNKCMALKSLEVEEMLVTVRKYMSLEKSSKLETKL